MVIDLIGAGHNSIKSSEELDADAAEILRLACSR